MSSGYVARTQRADYGGVAEAARVLTAAECHMLVMLFNHYFLFALLLRLWQQHACILLECIHHACAMLELFAKGGGSYDRIH